MGKLTTTFVASFGARILIAVLGLLSMTIYLRLLGPDDFGVVGFFLSLQAIVNYLDLGLGTTLVRKLSIHHVDNPGLVRRYAKTYEAAYAVLGLVVLTILLLLASWLAHGWLQTQSHQRPELPAQLRWASLAICLTWMASIYSSMLMGLERQKRLAFVQSVSAILRFALPVMAVSWQSNLTVFFMIQVIVSVGHLLMLRVAALELMKPEKQGGQSQSQVQWALIRSDIQFSAGMLAIFASTFLITQIDKIILSKMLSLADYGLYTLCITMAGGIYLTVQPLFNILYPRFSRVFESQLDLDAQQLYRIGAQGMALMVLPISAVIIALAPQVLWVWSGDAQVAEKGANVLRLLTLANALNAIMNLPYVIQLASGWTSLSVKVGCLATVFLGAFMVLCIDRWGIVGGASVVLMIHLAIFLLVPHITHARLLKSEKYYWLKNAVILPALVCGVTAGTAAFIWPAGYERWQNLFALLALQVLVTLLALIALPDLRHRALVFGRTLAQNSLTTLTKP